jgi:hypothetical protein
LTIPGPVCRNESRPSRRIAGCTIGAKILKPGEWFIAFKNKDFRRAQFEDDLMLEEDIFGIKGTPAWGQSSPAGEEERHTFSGLSLGINSHSLFCADANIKTLARKRNYDLLVECALRRARDASQVGQVLSDEIRKGYGWTNILAVDCDHVIAHEVSSKSVDLETGKRFVTRTNHFLKTPDWKVDYHQNAGTRTRFRDSYEKLSIAQSLADVFDLLRTHRSKKIANSICNHGAIHTVYSYVFEWKRESKTLYVCQGNPCSNEYVKLDITFPITAARAQEILEKYPSKRTRKKLETRALPSSTTV